MHITVNRIAGVALVLTLLPGLSALGDGLSIGDPVIPPIGGPGVPYVMTGTYVHGCFDPCACPIFGTDMVAGSFYLTPVSFKLGQASQYAVSGVSIQVGPPTPENPPFTGAGLYEILSGITVTHRMQLDLTTGPEGGFQHYDSGWVIGGFEFPDIDITVSINGMVCLDTVFEISATPANPADLNLDGQVNGQDLAILLGQWGRCPVCLAIIGPCPCLGDLNGDQQVNGLDVGILLGQWG